MKEIVDDSRIYILSIKISCALGEEMEKSTLIGIVLAVVSVVVGMFLKGASLSALLNPAAFLIIFVGTGATLCIAFPMSEVKKVTVLLKKVFQQPKLPDKSELVGKFVNWGTITRREGLLALENHIDANEDPFLYSGVQMAIDGLDQEFVELVMSEEIHAMEERHRSGALIFAQAGTYAPPLGVLGAVIGLVAALGNLSDIEKLGHSIAAAFIATLFGIFVGYVFCHPIANKLKRLSRQEVEVKQLIVEGVLSLQSGLSPVAIEKKLMAYLPLSERKSSKKGED